MWFIRSETQPNNVVLKDKKAFTADLKSVYNAPTKEIAEHELDLFDQKWGEKYPYSIKSWKANWENRTVFFDFPVEIRKIIYTTNLIENLSRLGIDYESIYLYL